MTPAELEELEQKLIDAYKERDALKEELEVYRVAVGVDEYSAAAINRALVKERDELRRLLEMVQPKKARALPKENEVLEK